MSAAAPTVAVAVLGAGGTIAPAIVRDLAESEEVASLRLLDLDGERAAAVAARARRRAGRRRARSTPAAASPPRCEGCDVLVNCASYRVNLDAMRACLRAGCHYIDLGGLYWLTERQLELRRRVRARRACWRCSAWARAPARRT